MKSLGWLLCATGCYAIFLAALSALNWSGADRFWYGALNLYLPQAIWAIPGIVLAIFLFRENRCWAWLPLLCVAWVLGPVMGLHWSPKPAATAPSPVTLRVMTWNIKYGSYDLTPLMAELSRCHPDVVFFQDATAALNGPLAEYFKNWQVRSHGQFVIASRYPLSEAEVFPLPAAGEGQEYLRCRLRLGETVVTLYNLHFRSPRWSLNAFRAARKQPWYLASAIRILDHNISTRFNQALVVRAALGRETGPTLVGGDLNSPDASQVCATLREAGLRDAFDERGRGYGFTYGHFLFKHRIPWLKVSWMRIDHIMTDAHFCTARCWTGTGQASDHRPVIADLLLQRP